MSGYIGQAAVVIDVIEERDSEMAEALVAEGVALGAPAEAIQGILVKVGLVTPPPLHVAEDVTAHTPVDPSGTSMEARMAAMEGNIARLVAAAERNGIRV